jgi:hypothetical protein
VSLSKRQNHAVAAALDRPLIASDVFKPHNIQSKNNSPSTNVPRCKPLQCFYSKGINSKLRQYTDLSLIYLIIFYLLFILFPNPVSSLAGRVPLISKQELDSSKDENPISASGIFVPAGAGPLVVAMLSTLDLHC